MAGRKPTPTALKALAGNPGKRELNRNEPKPVTKIPPCPKHLNEEARREWRRISKELAALRLLTVVDRAALAAYCQSWARWVAAEEELAKPGAQMVQVTDKGYHHPNPWIGIANQAMKQMRGFLGEFGMTPSSRSRVTVAAQAKADPYEEYRRNKHGQGTS